MLFSRCAPKVHVPLVAGPWRRPRSISASRAVLTRTLATDSNYTCTRLRSSSTSNGATCTRRLYFTSSLHRDPSEMAWCHHRPTPGCADVNSWAKHYPAAGGKRQSPINLTDGQYSQVLACIPLKLNYRDAYGCTLVNNGHSLQVNFKPSVGGLTNGPVRDNFELAQYHFHWGADNKRGSEHTVDGRFYPNELHLVHWNTSKCATVSEALSKRNGLTVLGIFLEPGEENVELKKITDRFEEVKHANQQVDITDPICIPDLLPSDTRSYWSYDGSLTTPPCYESVNWIVFKEPITVSQAQLEAFRSVYEATADSDPASHHNLVDNYRPVCPLNGRKLKTTFWEFSQ